jgi:desulfoferrodoxin (superoxide reductase-like protein)
MAGSRSAAAFSPTDPKTSKLALESNVCRSAECSSAALKQLKPLLDVSNVQVNAKGAESAHDLVVVKCAAFQEMDDNSIVVKVRVTAEGLDLVDNVAIIWIANTSTGEVLAARAETEDDSTGGAPTVNYEATVTNAELSAMKHDVLIPRLYCTTHGVWEGKAFTMAEYLDKGGLGFASYGEKKV